MDKLGSHFLNLYSIALADTSFDEREIATLYRIASYRGIEKEKLDHIILNPATVSFNNPESIEEKIDLLYDYAKMILADGEIDDSELQTFEKFCERFGFQSENIKGIIDVLIEAARNDVLYIDLIKFIQTKA